MTTRIFANDVVIDEQNHRVLVDGIEIPWWLAKYPGPFVRKVDSDDVPLLVLTLPIYVDGHATVITSAGRRVFDPKLGDVGEYARAKVRAAFATAYPDLELP